MLLPKVDSFVTINLISKGGIVKADFLKKEGRLDVSTIAKGEAGLDEKGRKAERDVTVSVLLIGSYATIKTLKKVDVSRPY